MEMTADFETTTQANDCRVWCWGLCEIKNPDNFKYGKTIDELMDYCECSDENHTLYFHNLKFDGEFIINWLFRNGFLWVKNRRDMQDRTFTTLISDKGQFYSMEILFWKKGKISRRIVIYDSLKIIPFSVSMIAKSFGLKIHKLEIDYNLERPIGYELTKEEVDYLHNDCAIVAHALNTLFSQNLTKMTQGSNALYDFKNMMGKKRFEYNFPIPDYDADIRHSYKGGFTYLNPKYKGKEVGKGIVLDVNSLYPAMMRNKYLPFGEGVFYKGKYKDDKMYPLYIQRFSCAFDLKKGMIPTVQIKRNLAFCPTEYLSSSNGEEVDLCMTNVDLTLFLEHYDVYFMEYKSGWKFKQAKGLFDVYIDKWSEAKIQAKLEGNKGLYTLAKLMLNALYGKFALNPNVSSKIPYLDENGIVRYQKGEDEYRDPIYLPVGTFITAYARDTTIRSAQSVYDRFIYADTDSLHLEGTDIPSEIEIDDTKLGVWKHESSFDMARFVRQKTYMERERKYKNRIYEYKDGMKGKRKVSQNGKFRTYTIIGNNKNNVNSFYERLVFNKITCAGLPERCYKYVTWENFCEGSSYDGKLMFTHVPGGIILKDTKFTMKGK